MAGDLGNHSGQESQRLGRYPWVALSNTTLGVLMATLDASIVIISMPAIFRGIHLAPLAPGNISYLLWMIMGYLLVTGVLVVAHDHPQQVADVSRREGVQVDAAEDRWHRDDHNGGIQGCHQHAERGVR